MRFRFVENGRLETPSLVTTTETEPDVVSSGVSTLIWSLAHTLLVTALQ